MTTPKSLTLWTKTNALRPTALSAWLGGHGITAFPASRKATDPLWRLLQALADAAVPAMLEDVALALASVGVSLDQPALLALLADGQRGTVARLVRAAWEEVGVRGLQDALAPKLEALALAAAVSTPIATVAVRFNVQDPEALSAMRTYAGLRIADISASTREAIQEILDRAFTSGTPLAQQVDEIAKLVGLTSQQSSSLAKWRSEALADGLPPAAVQAEVAARSAVMRRQRAENISRTESLSAVNAGSYERMAQAQAAGFITDETFQRQFIVTGDDRLCEICRPMNGQLRGLNAPFVSPFNGASALFPPMHVACRCTVSIIPI